MWIHREISKIIQENLDPIQIIQGPRQCGKSSLLLQLDSSFQEISLDDFNLRELAQRDPELFLSQFNDQKILIDEAQYAPALFPALKRRVDLYKRATPNQRTTIIRLTGSNQIMMDRFVKESLAGRASFFKLNTLSVSEITSHQEISIQEILYRGGWPELYAQPDSPPKKYLDNYINSYVEKDIVLSAGIQKQREFLKFVKLLAGRVGTLLDLSHFSREVGVESKTISDWISILEKMHLIFLVVPYFNNLSSRLTKTPKVYFTDTGLACRLQGWTSHIPISTSPQQGLLFENLVASEIYKTNQNYDLGLELFHWRSKDGEEVDFLIKKEGSSPIFIEAKTSPYQHEGVAHYPQVKKIFQKKAPPLYICHQEGKNTLGNNLPIRNLKNLLLNF